MDHCSSLLGHIACRSHRSEPPVDVDSKLIFFSTFFFVYIDVKKMQFRGFNQVGNNIIPQGGIVWFDWTESNLNPNLANTKHLYNICTTTAQRVRRWSNIV